jgi:hypothetical protein
MKKYNDILNFKEKDSSFMSNKNDFEFEEKENFISNNFNDKMHEEIYPIINSNNSIHIPDIINGNFFEEIIIHNPYLDIHEEVIYTDPITGEQKVEKLPSPSLPQE